MLISKQSFNSWLEYMGNYRNYSQNTAISYKLDVEGFLKYTEQNLQHIDKIQDLKAEDIRSWMAYCMEHHGKSTRANARGLSGLKNILNYLSIMEGIKVQNEILGMRPPKYVKPTPKMISEEEILFSKILSLGTDENSSIKWIALCDKSLILLMYGAGLRISEALSVNFINSIDVENMLITVNGKGGKARTIPMLPIILETLLKYIEYCPWIENDHYKNMNRLFFTKTGKFMSRNYFSNRIREYAGKYNLPYKVSPHSFRHSFATHLLENGTSINELQKLLGHSKLSSTEIYTQVSNQLLREMYYASHPKA
jgi:integrase/recombinase XerC